MPVYDSRDTTASIEAVIYAITHDLNQPITLAKGYLDLFSNRRNTLSEEKQITYIQQIQSALGEYKSLNDQLNRYLRAGNTHQISHIEFKILEENLRERLEPVIQEKKAELYFDAPPSIWIDSGHFNTVFGELLLNALSYISPNVEPKISVTFKKINATYVAIISDNGMGLSENITGSIFDILCYSTKFGKPKRYGVGFAICKKIIDKLGGSINVASDKNGTTIQLCFPIGD